VARPEPTAAAPLTAEEKAAIRKRAVAQTKEALGLIAWHSASLEIARTDIPRLLAEIERLEEIVTWLKGAPGPLTNRGRQTT
jgi:hypothetical protein